MRSYPVVLFSGVIEIRHVTLQKLVETESSIVLLVQDGHQLGRLLFQLFLIRDLPYLANLSDSIH